MKFQKLQHPLSMILKLRGASNKMNYKLATCNNNDINILYSTCMTKYILTPLTVHPIYDGNVYIGNLARDFK